MNIFFLIYLQFYFHLIQHFEQYSSETSYNTVAKRILTEIWASQKGKFKSDIRDG